MHQFGSKNRQTALVYGTDELELWDPIDKKLIGMLNGDGDKLRVEQVEPVSPSVLAIVSAGVRAKQRVLGGKELFFTTVQWSTQNDQFPNMPIQEWDEDPYPGMGISVVEGIESAASSDENQVSLFTGDVTHGFVYRRIFDITQGKAKKIGEQRMANRHRGTVSALCHIETGNFVVSGNTTGKLYLNDDGNGLCTQTIDVGRGITIGSLNACPFSRNLFMVGCCNPKNKLRIFDNRLHINRGKPSLVLKDDGSVIKSKYNRPAWDAESGLICSPVRKCSNGSSSAVMNIWDPRFVKCSSANNIALYNGDDEVFAVDFTKSVAGRDRVMVTANEDSIGFTDISIGRVKLL